MPHMEPPSNDATDWATWLLRGALTLGIGLLGKLFHDVEILKRWRAGIMALNPVRDKERRKILRSQERTEKMVAALLRRQAYEDGRSAGAEAEDNEEYDDDLDDLDDDEKDE